MKRIVVLGLTLTLFVGGSLPSATAQSPTTSEAALENLAWLEGAWDRETRRGTTTETWTRLGGGNYSGDATATPRDGGAARGVERLQIALISDEVVYIAEPINQSRTEFKLTSWTESEFVFENPEHDFPQKIVYLRTGESTFTATISGPDANGDTQEIDFPFTRRGED